MLLWTLLAFGAIPAALSRNCSTPFRREVVQLIVDYAAWRNIATLYIVDEAIRSDCHLKALRHHWDCFNQNGLRVAFQKRFHKSPNPRLQVKRILIVSFISQDMDFDNYTKQLSLFSNDIYFMWFHIYDQMDASEDLGRQILPRLGASAITLSLDFVIAAVGSRRAAGEVVRPLQGCSRPLQPPVAAPAASLRPGGNATFKSLCSDEALAPSRGSFCLLQLYKLRKSCNASLVVRPLGHWIYESGTANLREFEPVDMRIDFQGIDFTFGKKQSGKEMKQVSEEAVVEDVNDMDNLDSIADYITAYLNATKSVKSFPTLGLKGETGNWSGLLGAVISQEVDLGLDSVIKTPELYRHMVFTQDIFTSERHMYVKPEQSDGARDIFLATFQPNLLVHVLATGLLLAAAMAIYIVAVRSRLGNWSWSVLSDSLIWSLGIISMQGTQIQPKSASGNMIIVTSLIFALVIYNAYSAFITSKLSVKLTEIRTVSDLLASNYDVGYATNSPDEVFLRSVNQSQLNQIYLRGYLQKNINNITDGLLKATKGNYGFFASRHVARKAFLKISGYKCKFEIMEIATPQTKNSVAFPMSPTSPYRKAVDRCLIKMRESGVHDYIKSSIAPQLPKCDQQSNFQSARLNDIVTAIALFHAGIVAALLIFAAEWLWKKKGTIWAKMKRALRACRP